MLPDPCGEILYPVNGPSWSLFFELVVNIVFALVLWRSSLRLILAMMAISLLYFVFRYGPPHYFNVGWDWENVFAGLMRTVFSFYMAIVLYRMLPSGLRRPSHLSLVPVLAMAMVIGWSVPESLRLPIEIAAVALILPSLLALGAVLDAPTPMMRRVFGILGDLSYPVYVIHWPLLAIAGPAMQDLGLSPAISIALYLGLMIPMGYGAGRIDVAVRRKIGAALRRRPPAEPMPV